MKNMNPICQRSSQRSAGHHKETNYPWNCQAKICVEPYFKDDERLAYKISLILKWLQKKSRKLLEHTCKEYETHYVDFAAEGRKKKLISCSKH